ncbi:DUF433 domain-containing protein [Bradyrhizobium betae]|uniref:DUF433 domain-containing protein n=1 Tax=Bradyrhizobium betae TaxID=244734 RepID=UPI003D66ED71
MVNLDRRTGAVAPGRDAADIDGTSDFAMETVMAAPRRSAAVMTEVVSDPTVMSGDPVVRGTRILAETILSYLRADCSPEEIFRDYPSLPVDGIDAVARWAETTYGPGWRSMDAPAPQH